MVPQKIVNTGRCLLVGLVCACLGCDGSSTDETASARLATSPSALSPTQVVSQVQTHKARGELSQLGIHIHPDQRGGVIELIRAVDRLLGANGVLQAAVIKHFGPGSARTFDRSGVANSIGPFSRDVGVVDEKIDGDRAAVLIQVAKRLPLETVELVRVDGRWVIRTDAPVPGLAKELSDLAQAMTDTARMLDRRKLSRDELQRELSAREASAGHRIDKLLLSVGDESE